MNAEQFKHIVCAVRGKPESRNTVIRAIDLALEHSARLTFCLVIEAEFLAKAAPTLTSLSPVYRQLEGMSDFSMLILCDRAERRGVKEVNYLIRRGNIPVQIRQLASDLRPDALVLGRPIRGIRGSVFTPEEFDLFVEALEKDFNIQVLEVHHESGFKENKGMSESNSLSQPGTSGEDRDQHAD